MHGNYLTEHTQTCANYLARDREDSSSESYRSRRSRVRLSLEPGRSACSFSSTNHLALVIGGGAHQGNVEQRCLKCDRHSSSESFVSLTRTRCQHNVDIIGYKLQQATNLGAHRHKWYAVPREAILYPGVQSHQHISYEFRSWLASRHILESPSHLQAPSPQLYL
ncbi:hypothetical protein IG631_09328 [Alternaria alternata]|nr:hypothetical protein IG631_09328 [Alternaria alternata]